MIHPKPEECGNQITNVKQISSENGKKQDFHNSSDDSDQPFEEIEKITFEHALQQAQDDIDAFVSTKYLGDLPPCIPIAEKEYSLQPDMIFGWKPQIKSKGIIPLVFEKVMNNSIIQQLHENEAAYKNQFQVVYIGPRPRSTTELHENYANKPGSYTCQIDISNQQQMALVAAFVDMFNSNYPKIYELPFVGKNPSLQYNLGENLIFDSFFQSGNLDSAVKITDNQYDLLMRVDSNTRGHFNWYYFSVSNMYLGQRVKFNILNFSKNQSLYLSGMKPYILSEREKNSKNIDWHQEGENITYQEVDMRFGFLENYMNEFQEYYCLSFEYECQYSDDQVYFAYCVPYTYSKLLKYLQQKVELNKALGSPVKVEEEQLCLSLSGVDVPLLTITENENYNAQSSHLEQQQPINLLQNLKQQEEEKKNFEKEIEKKVILVSARIHPGQSNGSWVMHGMLDFLFSNLPEAIQLRQRAIFKIIPMINPDGVIIGNYRTGAAGKDLNRVFHQADKSLFPTVYQLQQLVSSLKTTYGNRFFMFLDLHGHSTKKNVFSYGPEFPIFDLNYFQTRLFCQILSQKTALFRYFSSLFKISHSKRNTARAIIFKNFNIPFCFTIEASNGSYYNPETNSNNFNQSTTTTATNNNYINHNNSGSMVNPNILDFNTDQWVQMGGFLAEGIGELLEQMYLAEKKIHERIYNKNLKQACSPYEQMRKLFNQDPNQGFTSLMVYESWKNKNLSSDSTKFNTSVDQKLDQKEILKNNGFLDNSSPPQSMIILPKNHKTSRIRNKISNNLMKSYDQKHDVQDSESQQSCEMMERFSNLAALFPDIIDAEIKKQRENENSNVSDGQGRSDSESESDDYDNNYFQIFQSTVQQTNHLAKSQELVKHQNQRIGQNMAIQNNQSTSPPPPVLESKRNFREQKPYPMPVIEQITRGNRLISQILKPGANKLKMKTPAIQVTNQLSPFSSRPITGIKQQALQMVDYDNFEIDLIKNNIENNSKIFSQSPNFTIEELNRIGYDGNSEHEQKSPEFKRYQDINCAILSETKVDNNNFNVFYSPQNYVPKEPENIFLQTKMEFDNANASRSQNSPVQQQLQVLSVLGTNNQSPVYSASTRSREPNSSFINFGQIVSKSNLTTASLIQTIRKMNEAQRKKFLESDFGLDDITNNSVDQYPLTQDPLQNTSEKYFEIPQNLTQLKTNTSTTVNRVIKKIGRNSEENIPDNFESSNHKSYQNASVVESTQLTDNSMVFQACSESLHLGNSRNQIIIPTHPIKNQNLNTPPASQLINENLSDFVEENIKPSIKKKSKFFAFSQTQNYTIEEQFNDMALVLSSQHQLPIVYNQKQLSQSKDDKNSKVNVPAAFYKIQKQTINKKKNVKEDSSMLSNRMKTPDFFQIFNQGQMSNTPTTSGVNAGHNLNYNSMYKQSYSVSKNHIKSPVSQNFDYHLLLNNRNAHNSYSNVEENPRILVQTGQRCDTFINNSEGNRVFKNAY